MQHTRARRRRSKSPFAMTRWRPRWKAELSDLALSRIAVPDITRHRVANTPRCRLKFPMASACCRLRESKAAKHLRKCLTRWWQTGLGLRGRCDAAFAGNDQSIALQDIGARGSWKRLAETMTRKWRKLRRSVAVSVARKIPGWTYGGFAKDASRFPMAAFLVVRATLLPRLRGLAEKPGRR